jgi:hypothetical protein
VQEAELEKRPKIFLKDQMPQRQKSPRGLVGPKI